MKKFLILVMLLALSFSFFAGCREKSEINLSNVPNYLKEVYPVLVNEGIKVNYNPYIGDNIKASPESKSELKEKFPSSWIKGNFTLPLGEHIETFFMYGDNNGYIITRKSIFAGADYKSILNLYNVKDGRLSLMGTLDRAPNKENASGGSAGNFQPQINGSFVVWIATPGASDTIGNYEIWAYDINKRESFKITSYLDEFTHFENFGGHCPVDGPCDPLFKLYPNNKLVVQTIFEDTESKTYFTRIKLYDLNTRKDETLVLSKDYNYLVSYSGSALVDNALFVERCKLYKTPDENKKFASYDDIVNKEVVEINLNTKKVSSFIPKYFIVYGSLNNRVLLVAFDPDYPYHDVWLYNPQDKTLDCVLKAPIGQIKDKRDYFFITSKVYLLNSGLIYLPGSPETTVPEYYFSFVKNQLFYIGNSMYSSNNRSFILPKDNYLLVCEETGDSTNPSEDRTVCSCLLIKPE